MQGADLLKALATDFKGQRQGLKVIMSFGEFLDQLKSSPSLLSRNAVSYLCDMFDHFGEAESSEPDYPRYKIFDLGTGKGQPIIGGEKFQSEIVNTLRSFKRQGYSNRLVLLHGPNGSAKSSTMDAIANGMAHYSETDQGMVYKFNWIFPTERSSNPKAGGELGPMGFGAGNAQDGIPSYDSYALLDETKVSCKIHSEFKENPIYLIPMPLREKWLKKWIADETGKNESEVEVPAHLKVSGLSKKNQLIFENLLNGYDGDIGKVFQHVQIERFFYSKQYRVGVATVEPQMTVDAKEAQLTMDKNIQNLPSVLLNIRFHEAFGELVEANRGILDFADMLKRPVEAFKYLLSAVESNSVNLPSSTATLDMVFFGTTNEKHLDAFKTLPDFTSFRGRFEVVTVPYLLSSVLEEKIYKSDIEAISKVKEVCPHALEVLTRWAVLTRLKQPDAERYDSKFKGLIGRLDPESKLRLYNKESLKAQYKSDEEAMIYELRKNIMSETDGMVIYEGRFGASPREVKSILLRASQNSKHETLTPMAIIEELTRLVKDRTVYEFLQYEPRGKYHDAGFFIELVKADFIQRFEYESLIALDLVEEDEYDNLLEKYISQVVAHVKKEKVRNRVTGQYENPSDTIMREVEKILGITGSIEKHREGLLGKIAAFKIDNPDKDLNLKNVFSDYLKKIQGHYHSKKKEVVDRFYQHMAVIGSDAEKNLKPSEIEAAKKSYSALNERFGYDFSSAKACLKYLLSEKSRGAEKS